MTDRFPNVFIHPSAEVENDVQIGEGSRIWHLVHIRSGARIGRNCNLGRNVYVDTNVSIGDGCKIQNGVNVYEGVTLEDQVFVGPAVTFTNVPTRAPFQTTGRRRRPWSRRAPRSAPTPPFSAASSYTSTR